MIYDFAAVMASERLRRIYIEIDRNEDIPQALFKRLLHEPASELNLVGEIVHLDHDDKSMCVELEGDILPTSRYMRYVRLLQCVVGPVKMEEVLDIESRKFVHDGVIYYPWPEDEEMSAANESIVEPQQNEGGRSVEGQGIDIGESQPLFLSENLLETEDISENVDSDEESQSILSPRRRR